MKRRLMGMLCLLGILTLTALPVGAITPPIEDAVVHGYWEQVFIDLKADSAGVDDPVGRLLMGHACLATQRNYGATSLFSTVTEPEDLAAWRSYTDDLVARYPDNHITLYLRGDAKMRQDQFDDPRFREPALAWIEHWTANEHPWRLEARTLEGHNHFSALPEVQL